MSEERFDRLEKMMEKVITKVDSLDTRMGSLEVKMDSLETRMGSLETKVDSLEAKVDSLEVKVDSLDAKVDALDTKVEHYGQIQQDDVHGLLQVMDKKLTNLSEDMKSLAEVIGDHEIRIRTLARRPV